MVRYVDKRLLLVLIVAAVFLAMFVRGLHWAELFAVLRATDLRWLSAAACLMVGMYAAIAVRWLLVVRQLDPGVPARLIWSATAIGAAFNTFLPLRGGDIVKPLLVSQRRDLPFAALLSTTVVERVLDLFGIVGTTLVLVAIVPPEIVGSPKTYASLVRWGTLAGVVAVCGLGAVWFLATRQARALVFNVLRPLPGHLRRRGYGLFSQLARGLEATGNPWRLAALLGMTAVIWVFTVASVLAVFEALHHPMPLSGGLFVSVTMTAAIAVPQAPGFLGLFQVAMEQAASVWGVPEAVAEAGSFALWAVHVVPITLLGFVAASRDGHGFFQWRRELIDERTSEIPHPEAEG